MTPRDVLLTPVRAFRLLVYGAQQLADVYEQVRRSTKTERDSLKNSGAAQRQLERVGAQLGTLREELGMLRREVRERLLQYHLQLGRLSRVVGNRADEVDLSGRTLPIEAGEPHDAEWESIGDERPPDPEGLQWSLLDACSVCGHSGRTVVSPWNKFILT